MCFYKNCRQDSDGHFETNKSILANVVAEILVIKVLCPKVMKEEENRMALFGHIEPPSG